MITTSRDEFARAVRFHQAGDLTAAAGLYQRVLDHDRADADALHLLGVVRHQQGDNDLAAELIQKAVAMRPAAAIYHASLAEVHRAVGQLDLAISRGCEALRLGLDDCSAHNNLGLALHGLGRYAEAAGAFLAALQSSPDYAMAHTNLGVVLRALGEDRRALEHLNRAVELDPRLASARGNLARFLLETGHANAALGHCQAAIALRPDSPDGHETLGNIYHALGHLAEARWCYGEAIRLKPEMPRACVNLAAALQQEGRWDEALPWLRRACELEPGSTEHLVRLAQAAVERERYVEAIACYQRIIELDPGAATAHNALGWLFQEEGQLDLAGEHLQAALRLRPDLAAAQLNLGGLHEKLGDFPAAETSFRTALADDGARSAALARLAMLLGNKLPDVDREALTRQLANSDANDPLRVNLLFARVSVLDASQRYAEAADCAREANALALAGLRRRDLVHDPAHHERFVSELIEAFDQALFDRLAGAGLDTRRPVFIIGLPRSGTSLIEQVLSSHSQFHGAGELPLARLGFQAIPGLLDRPGPPVSCISSLTADVVRELARRHDDQLRALDGGVHARIGDKMPDNHIHLGLLTAMFPNAVVIHCRRDLRDVAASCWLTAFQSVYWTNDEVQIASRIQQYDRLIKHWRSAVPTDIHDVDYEETVDDLEGVARRLLDICGLEWEPACLDFHRTKRPIRTASFAQVRRPVYRSSVGRWRNYETELAGLFAALPSRT